MRSMIAFSALRAFAICNQNWFVFAIVLALGLVPTGLQLVSICPFYHLQRSNPQFYSRFLSVPKSHLGSWVTRPSSATHPVCYEDTQTMREYAQHIFCTLLTYCNYSCTLSSMKTSHILIAWQTRL